MPTVTTPAAKHALLLTLEIAAIAVPANTVFGVICALAIVRQRFPGKGIVNADRAAFVTYRLEPTFPHSGQTPLTLPVRS